LPAAIEVAVYRIVEEATVNVVKHAAAATCLIRLDFDQVLALTVEDDGVGFEGGRGVGVGLQSMRERADELGGTFEIGGRADGPGARLVVRLPLPTPNPPESGSP
jgi:signal transduction histidine kinase